MGTLGHKVFEPLTKPMPMKKEDIEDVSNEDRKLFLKRTIKGVGTVEAVGSQTTEGFVVFEGSHISPTDDDTIPVAIKDQRKKANVDVENILKETRKVETLHELIKNNGQNFNITELEKNAIENLAQ